MSLWGLIPKGGKGVEKCHSSLNSDGFFKKKANDTLIMNSDLILGDFGWHLLSQFQN